MQMHFNKFVLHVNSVEKHDINRCIPSRFVCIIIINIYFVLRYFVYAMHVAHVFIGFPCSIVGHSLCVCVCFCVHASFSTFNSMNKTFCDLNV